LLRGEALDVVSDDVGVEIYRLESCRDQALAGMEGALKQLDSDPLVDELKAAKLQIGELTMAVEILARKRRSSSGALYPGGSRGDDQDLFALRWEALWRIKRICGLTCSEKAPH
jgi:hypothetical protein